MSDGFDPERRVAPPAGADGRGAGDPAELGPRDAVRVSEADFDVAQELRALSQGDLGVGALVSFTGLVRQWPAEAFLPPDVGADGGIELEHYPGMTQAYLQDLVRQAKLRFEVRAVRVVHRVGRLRLGEQIVLVAVAAAHRHSAFAAADFIMDLLKTQAPFWKKETAAGQSRWVSARESDQQAARRWQDGKA